MQFSAHVQKQDKIWGTLVVIIRFLLKLTVSTWLSLYFFHYNYLCKKSRKTFCYVKNWSEKKSHSQVKIIHIQLLWKINWILPQFLLHELIMHNCAQIVWECFSHFKILLISQCTVKCHRETIPDTTEKEGCFRSYSELSVTDQLFITNHI